MYRELEGEYILLNLNTERYYMLNEVGSFIFSLILAGKTIPEIEEAISRKYKTADEKMIKQDVRDFIRQLQTKRMVCTVE